MYRIEVITFRSENFSFFEGGERESPIKMSRLVLKWGFLLSGLKMRIYTKRLQYFSGAAYSGEGKSTSARPVTEANVNDIRTAFVRISRNQQEKLPDD